MFGQFHLNSSIGFLAKQKLGFFVVVLLIGGVVLPLLGEAVPLTGEAVLLMGAVEVPFLSGVTVLLFGTLVPLVDAV